MDSDAGFQESVDLSAGAFSHREAGDAPPLVLLHALGRSASDWDHIVGELKKNWRCLALDQRGHGDSVHTDQYRFGLMEHNVSSLGDREDFLDWFNTTWRAAEDALHDGDAGPRSTIWSEREPVTLFGLWFNATDPKAARTVFQRLAETFGDNASSAIDLIAADVSSDLAYTVHREITSTSIDGVPSDYVLRVTQVYKREDGEWKVVHRHGDRDPEET